MSMTGDHTAKSSAEEMRIVNHAVPKVDSEALVTGKAVYTNDLAPEDCLIVKIIRSPHAHALIKEINTERAQRDQYRAGEDSARDRMHPDIQGLSGQAVYDGGSDLSRAQPL